ncbi:N-acetylglucosamine kinase [Alkalicoccus saliphilus]|uniref:ATPase n=1 Tax=Alkalicoccus saliphilus TaxID=200989 RepID=A0A2T4U556_9BACI|nr:BadF/BadG/BcrA/BcrD ATPase family protein [Alkalicoccus saliphilus]PTL38519.1 ATPase [Alkalicoccus saliphilus]
MEYVIGIDGGGTKTSCLFYPADAPPPVGRKPPLLITGEGTNPHVIGWEKMQDRLVELLQRGMEKFQIPPSRIRAVCCGLAGVGRPDDRIRAEAKIRQGALQLLFSENSIIFVESDLFAALHGALPPDKQAGMLLIAGTGSNAIARTAEGDIFRSGGWGHLLGDEGSGYQIGLQTLQHAARAYDYREEEGLLSEMILEKMSWQNLREMVAYMYEKKPDKKEIAAFAPLVMRAADNGDKTALRILRTAADELLLHIRSLQKRSSEFTEATPVATTGSIITHSRIVHTYFQQGLKDQKLGKFTPSSGTPAEGAALKAQQLYADYKKAR